MGDGSDEKARWGGAVLELSYIMLLLGATGL